MTPCRPWRATQEQKTTTFSASLALRIELALRTVRRADGLESASEQLYQLIGAGTSTIESVPCAIAMVELAGTDPNQRHSLRQPGWRYRYHRRHGDGDLRRFTGFPPSMALSRRADEVNKLDFTRYADALMHYRQRGGRMNANS